VVYAVNMSKVLGLLFGELRKGTEEAQIDRPLAAPSKKPLHEGSVLRPNEPKRNIDAAG